MKSTLTRMLKSIDPASGRELATFDEADDAAVEAAIAKAWDVRHGWRDAGIEHRARLLKDVAGVLRADKARYASILTSEMGKPIVEAEGEVEKCAWTAAWIADNAARLLADEPIESTATQSYIRYQPLGVVLAVMPWNFPFWQTFRAGLPALAAGNVMLLKHASNVPQSALAIEEVFRKAGLPEGVFQTLLIGSGAVDRIISDRRVAGVTLTGSEAAGAHVAATAGKALKKAVLELGGSDPFVVLEDADVELAATVACRARNQNNGQSCIAAKRFIVVEDVADDFEQRFSAAVAGLAVGDPARRDVNVGPRLRQRHGGVRRAPAVRRRQALGLRQRALRVRHARVPEHPDGLGRAGKIIVGEPGWFPHGTPSALALTVSWSVAFSLPSGF